ncbi:hypothetical protein D3C81_2267050 [compost metagenome]
MWIGDAGVTDFGGRVISDILLNGNHAYLTDAGVLDIVRSKRVDWMKPACLRMSSSNAWSSGEICRQSVVP